MLNNFHNRNVYDNSIFSWCSRTSFVSSYFTFIIISFKKKVYSRHLSPCRFFFWRIIFWNELPGIQDPLMFQGIWTMYFSLKAFCNNLWKRLCQFTVSLIIYNCCIFITISSALKNSVFNFGWFNNCKYYILFQFEYALAKMFKIVLYLGSGE